MRRRHKGTHAPSEMVELPIDQPPDFRLQGCTRGALDCRGRVLRYMKFHDVEEQSRLSANIPVD